MSSGVSAAVSLGGARSGDGAVEASPPTESASQESAAPRQSIRESDRENGQRGSELHSVPMSSQDHKASMRAETCMHELTTISDPRHETSGRTHTEIDTHCPVLSGRCTLYVGLCMLVGDAPWPVLGPRGPCGRGAPRIAHPYVRQVYFTAFTAFTEVSY